MYHKEFGRRPPPPSYRRSRAPAIFFKHQGGGSLFTTHTRKTKKIKKYNIKVDKKEVME